MEDKDPQKSFHYYVIAAVVILAFAFVMSKSAVYIKENVTNKKVVNAAIEKSIADWKDAKPQSLKQPDIFSVTNNLAKGSEKQVTLVTDLLCTDCATVFNKLDKLSQEGKARFSVYLYPLDSYCNSHITYRSDGLGCQLSASVICAEQLYQKGFELTKSIFSRNKEIVVALAKGPQILNEQLDKLSLDKTKIETCAKSPETLKQIQASADSIKNIEFTRLPIFLYKQKIYNAALIDSGIEDLFEENP